MGGAEGDAHIKGDLAFPQLRRRLPAGPGRPQAQPRPLRRNQIFHAHGPQGLPLGFSGVQHLGHQPGRADTRQRPPRRDLAGDCHRRLEKAQLDQLLADPVVGKRILLQRRPQGPGLAHGPPSVPVHPGRRRDPHRAKGQLHRRSVFLVASHRRKNRLIPGKEHRHDLLHGVLVVVSDQLQLHTFPNCSAERIKGLLLRSCSRVEVHSCPGYTL